MFFRLHTACRIVCSYKHVTYYTGQWTYGAPFRTPLDKFIIELPVAADGGAGDVFGKVFGSSRGTYDLDLRLPALELNGNDGVRQLYKVLTPDDTPAKIEEEYLSLS